MFFDYAFVGDHSEIKDQDEAGEREAKGANYIKILVARDSRSKALFGHVVPVKGIDEEGFCRRLASRRHQVVRVQPSYPQERQRAGHREAVVGDLA